MTDKGYTQVESVRPNW